MSEDQEQINEVKAEEQAKAETLDERFKRCMAVNRGLRIGRWKDFRETKLGSYPIYETALLAPFIAEDGRVLQAVVMIKLNKAEWIGGRRDQIYRQRHDEAMNKLLDWVDAMEVPTSEKPDAAKVTVAEWGVPMPPQAPEQAPMPGQNVESTPTPVPDKKIVLTDL